MRFKIMFGDIIIITLVILFGSIIALSLYQKDTGNKAVVISQNNVLIDRITLHEQVKPYSLSYSGKYPGEIEVQNGKARFAAATCPDQVCVHTGWIEKPGEIAVCLPAGVLIKIEGVEETDIDIIIR